MGSRPMGASMSATMITAVIFHLLNTGGEAFPLGVPKAHSYNYELAAMYVFVLGYFTLNGAGKYSVDEQVLGGELNFYSGLFDRSSVRRSSCELPCQVELPRADDTWRVAVYAAPWAEESNECQYFKCV